MVLSVLNIMASCRTNNACTGLIDEEDLKRIGPCMMHFFVEQMKAIVQEGVKWKNNNNKRNSKFVIK